MKIIYCHHAQRKRNNPSTQEDGITKLGEKDAEIASELFAQLKNVKAIYCSTFFRCKKTAEIINTKLKAPIIFDERLNEAGSVKGETWLDTQNRILSLLNQIYEENNDEDIFICVTSGVNVGAFICWNFEIEPNQNLPRIGVPSLSPLCFEKRKK